MPTKSELGERGGLKTKHGEPIIRRKKLRHGRYITIYVVKRKGPRGGHSLAGEVQTVARDPGAPAKKKGKHG